MKALPWTEGNSKVMTNEMVDGEAVENVKNFNFLGSVVPAPSNDIKQGIALDSTAFGKTERRCIIRQDIKVLLRSDQSHKNFCL